MTAIIYLQAILAIKKDPLRCRPFLMAEREG